MSIATASHIADNGSVDPNERVCPRCGTTAGQHEFCHTCGLHLWQQPELPTRNQWENARQSDVAGGPSDAPSTYSPPHRRIVERIQEGPKLAVGIGAAAVGLVIVVLVLISGTGESGATLAEKETAATSLARSLVHDDTHWLPGYSQVEGVDCSPEGASDSEWICFVEVSIPSELGRFPFGGAEYKIVVDESGRAALVSER